MIFKAEGTDPRSDDIDEDSSNCNQLLGTTMGGTKD
jgi:hypothetical protein